MNDKYFESKMTKAEAEKIFGGIMLTKEFWIVYEDNDNSMTLQVVLDTLFNSVKGNYYTTKYIDGCNTRRLAIYCNICHKELSSFDPFRTHHKGKAHKKSLASVNMKVQVPKDIIFKDPSEGLSSFNFEINSIEERLIKTSHPVVGVNFIYKEEEARNRYFYTCHLCKQDKNVFRISEKEIYSHIISDFHILKYMKVAHNVDAPFLKDIMPQVKDVMECEGRITCNIVLLKYESSYRNLYKKRSLPENKENNNGKNKHSTADSITQTESPESNMSDFLCNLKNCIEEEREISSHLEGLGLPHQKFLLGAIKFLSSSLMGFFNYHDSAELKEKTKTFAKMGELE